VPSSGISRHWQPTKLILSILGVLVIACVAGILGLFFFGLGCGVIFALGAAAGLLNHAIRSNGNDHLQVTCPSCNHIESYGWPRGALQVGRMGNVECVSCGIKLRIAIAA
jgi:hypothetical protein